MYKIASVVDSNLAINLLPVELQKIVRKTRALTGKNAEFGRRLSDPAHGTLIPYCLANPAYCEGIANHYINLALSQSPSKTLITELSQAIHSDPTQAYNFLTQVILPVTQSLAGDGVTDYQINVDNGLHAAAINLTSEQISKMSLSKFIKHIRGNIKPGASLDGGGFNQITIICADAQQWLKTQKTVPNVVTGICDWDEMQPGKNRTSVTLESYLKFFHTVANEIMKRLDPQCYAIFIQTDRKYQKRLISKAQILLDTATANNLKCVWHKIVLHRPVSSTHLQRPTYAHMLCFGGTQVTTGAATPDVLPPGKKLYANGTPWNASQAAIDFVARYSPVKTVLDPFVGRGTIAAIAQKAGLAVIGIDLDPKQCQATEQLLKKS